MSGLHSSCLLVERDGMPTGDLAAFGTRGIMLPFWMLEALADPDLPLNQDPGG